MVDFWRHSLPLHYQNAQYDNTYAFYRRLQAADISWYWDKFMWAARENCNRELYAALRLTGNPNIAGIGV